MSIIKFLMWRHVGTYEDCLIYPYFEFWVAYIKINVFMQYTVSQKILNLHPIQGFLSILKLNFGKCWCIYLRWNTTTRPTSSSGWITSSESWSLWSTYPNKTNELLWLLCVAWWLHVLMRPSEKLANFQVIGHEDPLNCKTE